MPTEQVVWWILCRHCMQPFRTAGYFADDVQFIIGNGLGSLETAANPYITVCGPPKYAEMRINLSQAFNGIGTVIAPVLGSYVFFDNIGDDVGSLRTVQWVYLAMACFTFLLAAVRLTGIGGEAG